MNLEDKIEILVRDYGINLLLVQSDLTEEDAITELVGLGLIDLQEYFYENKDVQIIQNED